MRLRGRRSGSRRSSAPMASSITGASAGGPISAARWAPTISSAIEQEATMIHRCLVAGLLATATLAPAQARDAIPDFSGIWSHPSFPGFEPPSSGPGPVTNTMRRPQVAAADGRVLPAVNDILVSNPALLVGDYTNPILKPEAAQVVKKHGEMELSGAGSPTPTIQCWPEPVPYIFNGVAMQMLQQR